MEDLADLGRIDDAVGVELHERVHDLAPPVMDRGVPEPIPGLHVGDLGVEEQDRVILEDRDLRDALALDLGHELGPDVVVMAAVLVEAARLEPHREGASDHRSPPVAPGSASVPVLMACRTTWSSTALPSRSSVSRPR